MFKILLTTLLSQYQLMIVQNVTQSYSPEKKKSNKSCPISSEKTKVQIWGKWMPQLFVYYYFLLRKVTVEVKVTKLHLIKSNKKKW